MKGKQHSVPAGGDFFNPITQPRTWHKDQAITGPRGGLQGLWGKHLSVLGILPFTHLPGSLRRKWLWTQPRYPPTYVINEP